MTQINAEMLEQIIRKVVAEQMAQQITKPEFDKHVDASGVAVVKAATVKCKPFDTGKPGDKVFITDLLELSESPRLGCGMMEMDKTTFDWTLEYDEVDYIIEGTLKVIIDGREVVGHAGDVIFIPKGSKIQFSAPDFARFLFVVYPANWEEIARQKNG
ncbi:cupin domain-containing protein [Kistimonas scapharcae]|uniref:Cupin domain-containing protein n=1 Tax=Kistimonas scapharcae TaxID=1036133 RepID=A0ABP8V308_9GAMM